MVRPVFTPPAPPVPGKLQRLTDQAFDIADRAVVCDIESECPAELRDSHTWRDTRPMLDPREHAPEIIDMALQAVEYALMRGLVLRHYSLPHLVRVVRRP